MSLERTPAHTAVHLTTVPSPASSARVGFLCTAAIVVRLEAVFYTPAGVITAVIGGGFGFVQQPISLRSLQAADALPQAMAAGSPAV